MVKLLHTNILQWKYKSHLHVILSYCIILYPGLLISSSTLVIQIFLSSFYTRETIIKLVIFFDLLKPYIMNEYNVAINWKSNTAIRWFCRYNFGFWYCQFKFHWSAINLSEVSELRILCIIFVKSNRINSHLISITTIYSFNN